LQEACEALSQENPLHTKKQLCLFSEQILETPSSWAKPDVIWAAARQMRRNPAKCGPSRLRGSAQPPCGIGLSPAVHTVSRRGQETGAATEDGGMRWRYLAGFC